MSYFTLFALFLFCTLSLACSVEDGRQGECEVMNGEVPSSPVSDMVPAHTPEPRSLEGIYLAVVYIVTVLLARVLEATLGSIIVSLTTAWIPYALGGGLLAYLMNSDYMESLQNADEMNAEQAINSLCYHSDKINLPGVIKEKWGDCCHSLLMGSPVQNAKPLIMSIDKMKETKNLWFVTMDGMPRVCMDMVDPTTKPDASQPRIVKCEAEIEGSDTGCMQINNLERGKAHNVEQILTWIDEVQVKVEKERNRVMDWRDQQTLSNLRDYIGIEWNATRRVELEEEFRAKAIEFAIAKKRRDAELERVTRERTRAKVLKGDEDEHGPKEDI